jgi:aminopeptidase C
MRDSFLHQSQQYDDRRKELRSEAEHLEQEVRQDEHKANRFDFGEALLEVALVITSITLLTRRRPFWYLGTAIGLLGIIVAVTGVFIR